MPFVSLLRSSIGPFGIKDLFTVINVLGGMAIGIVQKGMSFDHAASIYTTLTVGDGLATGELRSVPLSPR